jgi:hypothetical protein
MLKTIKNVAFYTFSQKHENRQNNVIYVLDVVLDYRQY